MFKRALTLAVSMLALAAAPALADLSKYEQMSQRMVEAGYSLDDPQIALGLAGYKVAPAPATYTPAPPGMMVEDLPYIRADGAQGDLGELRGRPALITYWGTWCGACQLEMDSLNDVIGAYKGSGLQILPIAVNDTPQSVAQYMARKGYAHIDANVDPQSSHYPPLGLLGTPSHLFLDATGQITALVEGPLDWNDERVRAYLDRLANEG